MFHYLLNNHSCLSLYGRAFMDSRTNVCNVKDGWTQWTEKKEKKEKILAWFSESCDLNTKCAEAARLSKQASQSGVSCVLRFGPYAVIPKNVQSKCSGIFRSIVFKERSTQYRLIQKHHRPFGIAYSNVSCQTVIICAILAKRNTFNEGPTLVRVV